MEKNSTCSPRASACILTVRNKRYWSRSLTLRKENCREPRRAVFSQAFSEITISGLASRSASRNFASTTATSKRDLGESENASAPILLPVHRETRIEAFVAVRSLLSLIRSAFTGTTSGPLFRSVMVYIYYSFVGVQFLRYYTVQSEEVQWRF